MIFKLQFEDRTEWAQAKSQLHLLQSYERDIGGFHEIQEVTEITDEEAKTIMLKNTDHDESDPESMPEISLFDTAVGDNFVIVGSTEWD